MTHLCFADRFRLAIASLALAVLALATLAPVAAASGRKEAAGFYLALAPLCHQKADRSWYFEDFPAALCIRCYGVYGGIAVAALLGLPFSQRTAAAGFLIVGGAWAAERLAGLPLTDLSRFASGGALGWGMAALGAPAGDRGKRGNRLESRGVESDDRLDFLR